MMLMIPSDFLMQSFPWHATELFLRVCEAGGLSAAANSGKAGVSQPALSAQMMALERHLGKTLFQRKPFALTEAGRLFQEEALRMRTRMLRIRDALHDESGRPLRIAASDVIIRDHLPAVLKQIDTATRTRLVLREAQSQDLARLVRDGDVDLAIGLLSGQPPASTSPLVEKIGDLPLVLHVPPSHAGSAETWHDVISLLRKDAPPGLIALPQQNLIMRHINTSLRRAGVEWPPTLEISSVGHVSPYVDLDFGFGFGFAVPGSGHTAAREARRIIPVPPGKMPPLHLVVWHGESPGPHAIHLLTLIRRHAGRILPKPRSTA